MSRAPVVLLVGLVAVATGVGEAAAKGTSVVVPEQITTGSAVCRPGSHPPERYRSDPRPITIGCVELATAEPTLLIYATRHESGIERESYDVTCVYAVAEGTAENRPPCFLTHPLAEGAVRVPLTGYPGIHAHHPRTLGLNRGAFVVIQASRAVRHVGIRYRDRDHKLVESVPAMLQVGSRVGDRLGAPEPFSILAGYVPANALTCRGVSIEGRHKYGTLAATDRITGWAGDDGTDPRPGIGFPGSDHCRHWAASRRLGSHLGFLASLVGRVAASLF